MEKIIDLHIHTDKSDGLSTPKEVIDEAALNGVQIIAIADHDTIDAYTEELYEYAKLKNIQLINAVEISTRTKKNGIHILGYNFDIKHQGLNEKLKLLRNARHDYLHNVARELNKLGYIINVASLSEIEAVTKAHIASDVVDNPENKELLLKEFGYVPPRGEFIETIMNEGCPAHVIKESISPKEVADLIREAGGKVVLAHPVAYQYEDGLSEEDILEIVKEIEADGIESNYIFVTQKKERIDDTDKWNDFAKKHNLIPTIGSDYHKKGDINRQIGLINDGLTYDEKSLNDLLS